MTDIQKLKEDLEKSLPPLIARNDISKYTGGLYSANTLAAYDSKNIGVPNPVHVGRKVAYHKDELIKWLLDKMEFCNEKS